MEKQRLSAGTEREAVGDAHAEYVGDVRPATSMVEVERLISPELLVEVEAVAVVDEWAL